MKICVYTLGCKVNQYESYSIINALRERGYEVTENLEVCDRYIINTCAVTGEAEKKSRRVISKVQKLNSSAFIYITGCASQNNAAKFAQKNVKYISGTAKKQDIIEQLENEGTNISVLPTVYEDVFDTVNVKTRAFIKVQDGCDNFCSYCIVPYLRGRSRSRSIESIRQEILKLSEVKEFVITGINITDYGKNEDLSLVNLIENLYDIDARIRLGSLEAGIIDEKLLNSLKKLQHFCPHFHLSMQSGSDKVLKDMNRHYTAEIYLKSVELVRKHFPFAAITTDVICGYPTETENDFLQTVNICKKAVFADMHIFVYSSRSGTAAAKLKPIGGVITKKRADILNGLKIEFKNNFAAINIGKPQNVLIECKEDGYYIGYTENYLKLYVCGNLNENQVYKAVPYEIYSGGAKAKIIF